MFKVSGLIRRLYLMPLAACVFGLSAAPSGAAPPVAAQKPPATLATPAPTSGPHPNWHGTWQGETPGSRLAIGPAGVDRTSVRTTEGKKRTHTERCKWVLQASNSGEACRSGNAKSSKAASAIQAQYERSVDAFRRDPTDFAISDPARSRAALRSVRPGIYRVLWTEGEGDCGRNEMIIDDDTILDVMECRYGHHVERFTRIR